MKLTESLCRVLLYELCVDLGFCLSPAAQTALSLSHPSDVQGFAREVFRIEGLNIETAPTHLVRAVEARIEGAFAAALAGVGSGFAAPEA